MTLAEYVEQVHNDVADIGCKLTCGKDCHTLVQEIVTKAIDDHPPLWRYLLTARKSAPQTEDGWFKST